MAVLVSGGALIIRIPCLLRQITPTSAQNSDDILDSEKENYYFFTLLLQNSKWLMNGYLCLVIDGVLVFLNEDIVSWESPLRTIREARNTAFLDVELTTSNHFEVLWKFVIMKICVDHLCCESVEWKWKMNWNWSSVFLTFVPLRRACTVPIPTDSTESETDSSSVPFPFHQFFLYASNKIMLFMIFYLYLTNFINIYKNIFSNILMLVIIGIWIWILNDKMIWSQFMNDFFMHAIILII